MGSVFDVTECLWSVSNCVFLACKWQFLCNSCLCASLTVSDLSVPLSVQPGGGSRRRLGGGAGQLHHRGTQLLRVPQTLPQLRRRPLRQPRQWLQQGETTASGLVTVAISLSRCSLRLFSILGLGFMTDSSVIQL